MSTEVQRDPRIAGASGLFLSLLPWGLGLIGVTVNVLLGALVLFAAFSCIVYALWIWRPAWKQWRFIFVLAGLALYCYLIIPKLLTELSAEDSIFSEQERLELLTLSSEMIKAKAMFALEFHQQRVARANLRRAIEDSEKQAGCLIDTDEIACLPKPPEIVEKSLITIDIAVLAVAEEITQSRFWLVRSASKLPVPIVTFVTLFNHSAEPVKVTLLYLEARLVNGWGDIRMADSLTPKSETMQSRPLVMLRENDRAWSMKGEYLVPFLYDRVIQPGDSVAGWVIAEYPKGIKHGNSIGDLRISLLGSNEEWVSSLVFEAHPTRYPSDKHIDDRSFSLDRFVSVAN